MLGAGTCQVYISRKQTIAAAIIRHAIPAVRFFIQSGPDSPAFLTGLNSDKDVIENTGLILGSEDLVTLDAVTNKMVDIDPETRSILKIGEEVFGQWD